MKLVKMVLVNFLSLFPVQKQVFLDCENFQLKIGSKLKFLKNCFFIFLRSYFHSTFFPPQKHHKFNHLTFQYRTKTVSPKPRSATMSPSDYVIQSCHRNEKRENLLESACNLHIFQCPNICMFIGKEQRNQTRGDTLGLVIVSRSSVAIEWIFGGEY